MPTFLVTLPVAGTFTTQVEAENADQAIQMALTEGLPDLGDVQGSNDTLELDVFEHLVEGNVSNCPTDDAYAEELDEETDEDTQAAAMKGERLG